MAEFADQAALRVKAGDGGHGCASVRREKFKPLGGPDGGNGGRGGDVILEVDPGTATLLDLQRRPVRRAGNGKQGSGSNRNGADGADLVVRVPDGTVVKAGDGEVLADLVGAGTRFVAAQGGRGGLGNAALASPRRKAPGFALRGEPGVARSLVLELKIVADAGLIGYPNAGKSSLIAAMSAARPKIGDYPFTTLTPHLGVVEAGQTQYVVADVPGLIPGASRGKGLGLDFLRHVERCSVLVHVLDCAAGPAGEPGREPVPDLDRHQAAAPDRDRLGAGLWLVQGRRHRETSSLLWWGLKLLVRAWTRTGLASAGSELFHYCPSWGQPPQCRQVRAAWAAPACMHDWSSWPLARAAMNPAMKLSPAPVVSTGSIGAAC